VFENPNLMVKLYPLRKVSPDSGNFDWSQKMTVAAMQMAGMKLRAERSPG